MEDSTYENRSFIDKFDDFILRSEKVILFILLVVSLIFIIILASKIESQWCQDSHWYMSLAKNLASGKGYTTDGKYPHGKYPPGLPFLILPFLFLFREVQTAGFFVIGLLSLLNVFLIYKIGKLSRPIIGFTAAILLATHNLFLFNAVSIMTEIPFMFFSLCSLYFFMKAFNKKVYIIFSLLFLSISILTRYEGIFLIFAFLFYSWKRKNEVKNLVFKKETLIGIIFFLIPLVTWLFRNFIVFGNPFYTAYSKELTTFSFIEAFNFIYMFFKTGIVCPYIAVIGLIFLLKEKNTEMLTFLVWFFVYILIHLFWPSKFLRFYVQVLPLICIFVSYGTVNIGIKIAKNKKKFFIFLGIVLLIIIVSQLMIFFYGDPKYGTTVKTFNRYESVRRLCVWANSNLPDHAIYIVPDVAVYSLYLNKTNLLYYDEGINYLLIQQNNHLSAYIFTDTLHPWITELFLEGEKGKINLRLRDDIGIIFDLIIETELIRKEIYNLESNASVMEVKSIFIKHPLIGKEPILKQS